MRQIKIYLDNCCFNRPYDDQTQERIHLEAQAKLYIQQLIVEKKVEFVWSYVLEFENSNNPYGIRKETIRGFSYKCIQYIDTIESNQISSIAKSIKKTGIKEKDALHLACAIFSECEYFISTDDRLLKFETEKLKVVDPMQFVKEMEANE